VIWLADEAIVGSAGAIERLRAAGHDVVFVSNNSSVPVAAVEEKLAAFAIPARGRVVTSAVVAAELVDPDEVVLLCAGPGVEGELDARGVTTVREGPADVVMVGYHRTFDYERLTTAAKAIWGGARLVATNDDATYPTPDGPIPGTGAILASIVRATGVTPVVAGKPNAPMVEHLRRRLGPEGIMVGDRPDTDGRFAVALGYDFGLVLSGVTRAADLPVEPAPALVAADLASLVDRALAHP
jgi:HAD superfamily hydrolase (TIGR01450 family)